MNGLFRFASAVERAPAIETWFRERDGGLCEVARSWFEVIRHSGNDIRELLHDGRPTACVGDAAFAYVDVFTKHVDVGFFRGAWLADPGRLLRGSGKSMRHVKIVPGLHVSAAALDALIASAYADMRQRLAALRAPPAGS